MTQPLHPRTFEVSSERAPFEDVTATVYSGNRDFIVLPKEKLRTELARETLRENLRLFTVGENSVPLARAAAMVLTGLFDEGGRPLGAIGYFEAIDDSDAVRILFDACLDYLKTTGVRTIIGPMNGDTWHTYRVNAGPFETAPFLMEPYNPPYYSKLWTDNGFEVFERYYSKRVHDLAALSSLYAESHRSALDNGVTFRPLDRPSYERELEILYGLTCRIFSENLLYTGISQRDFVELYHDAKSLVDPSLVWFAFGPGGEPCGFVFALPDYRKAVAAMRGERSIFAKFRFLLNRQTDTVNVKTLGVCKEYRSVGTAGALFHLVYENAHSRGLTKANLCLIREGNPSGKYDGGAGAVIRTYHLYRQVILE